MNHQQVLLDWCNARRGRATKLSRYIQKSREFVRAMANGDRPIPHVMHALIPTAMQKIEAEEAKLLADGMKHIDKMSRAKS